MSGTYDAEYYAQSWPEQAPLTPVECERAMAWTAAHRPDRITPSYAGGVTVVNLRVRDVDDEPWGDPVGLGMPRPRRHPLLRALWRALGWKYRRVW